MQIMLLDNLRPNLKAYIEYTNETWNTVFMQTHYTKQMGHKLRLDKDPNQAGYKYYSQRSVEIFKIFEQAFRGTQRLGSRDGRMVCQPLHDTRSNGT